MESVRTNLERVRERMARAAERSGRRPDDILLIGVSKTVPAERIGEAIAAGLPALGENRVQEAREKFRLLGRPIPWHLVGHLQSNKVKDALEIFDLIHSLDRIELAREIDRRAAKPVDVLVQVNVAGEASKTGFAPDDVKPALDALAAFTRVRVRGLMALPPLAEAEATRPWFRALRQLRDDAGLAELSMGMSGDFETAIEEGATMVRVGTAIFGEREKRR
jgi:PLP dependent protein